MRLWRLRRRGASTSTFPQVERLGWFDGLVGDHLAGWTLPGPTAPAEVVISAGSETRIIVADIYRGDLRPAGVTAAFSGFRAPRAWFPDAAQIFRCWRLDGRELPGSPWTVQAPSPYAVDGHDTVKLWLDSPAADSRLLTGLVFDPSRPTRRFRLTLRLASGRRVTQMACLHHAHSIALGGDGFHGFRFRDAEVPVGPASVLALSLQVDTGRSCPLN